MFDELNMWVWKEASTLPNKNQVGKMSITFQTLDSTVTKKGKFNIPFLSGVIS